MQKEKEPTTEVFDDDEWIRLLIEAEAVTADIPEGHVTCANLGDAVHDEQGRSTSQKATTHPDGRGRANIHLEASLGAQ